VKKGYKLGFKLAVSFILLYYLIETYELSAFYESLTNLNGYWVIIALGCMMLSNLIGTFQWNLILKQLDIHLPLRRTAAFYFTGLFFNNFLLSFIGGDVVRYYDIRKTSGKNSVAISTVLFDRFVGTIILASLALLGSLYMLYKRDSSDARIIFLGILLIFGILSFALLFLFNKPFAKRFESFGMLVTPNKTHDLLREIYNSLHYFRDHKLFLGALVFIGIFLQSARIYAHYSLAQSIDVSISIGYFFIFIPIITFMISLPISFGGIGVREGSASVLFQFAAVAGEDAAIFEGLAYIVAIICSLPGGIAFVFRKHEVKKSD